MSSNIHQQYHPSQYQAPTAQQSHQQPHVGGMQQQQPQQHNMMHVPPSPMPHMMPLQHQYSADGRLQQANAPGGTGPQQQHTLPPQQQVGGVGVPRGGVGGVGVPRGYYDQTLYAPSPDSVSPAPLGRHQQPPMQMQQHHGAGGQQQGYNPTQYAPGQGYNASQYSSSDNGGFNKGTNKGKGKAFQEFQEDRGDAPG